MTTEYSGPVTEFLQFCVRSGYTHHVSTEFDPFRLNQVHEPKPVDGDLPSVCLVDDDAELDATRPKWFRTLAAAIIAVFLGTTFVTMLRQLIHPSQPVAPSSAQ